MRHVAATEIMPYFLNVGTSRKQDGSMLTQADTGTQVRLIHELVQLINCPVLGEEMTNAQQLNLWQQGQKQGLWVIDPIDGTNNFINGIPYFTLSIAYLEQGRPLLGAILNPISQECFYAAQGQGAFLNGQPLPLYRADKTLQTAIAGVELKYLRSGKLSDRMYRFPPINSIRVMGCSTLDWCYLASGRYDVYLHGGQKLWDYAAGALIYTEAGGQLATLEKDEFWSGQHVFNRSAIAALQPKLFEEWLNWIRHNQ
ncbi:inositol monophosphatase family protein [Neisseriaceae bacterium ESL0693]|nr:inositol monophosphatase family protein [Neisseriaceae bacterium ESL0693]